MSDLKRITINGVAYDVTPRSHSEDTNNPHGSTAAQVGARPNDWMPTASEVGAAPSGYGLGTAGQLTNDWNTAMLSGFYYGKTNSPDGGWWAGVVYAEGSGYAFQHLYKNASTAQKVRECNNGTWGAWVDVSPSAFAPSGYGLGKTSNENMITSISDLDALKVNCNFLYASDANPIMVGSVGIAYAYGRVDAYDGNRAKMTIVPVFPEYKSTIVRYAGEGGTWGEWEWVNPHMQQQQEYRTAERVWERPLYKKLFYFGSLPNTSTASASHGIGNLAQVIRVTLIPHGVQTYLDHNPSVSKIDVDTEKIYITTTANLSGTNCFVLIEYNKA